MEGHSVSQVTLKNQMEAEAKAPHRLAVVRTGKISAENMERDVKLFL